MNFCKDCTNLVKDERDIAARCRLEELRGTDYPIHGKMYYALCSSMRNENGKCGPEGKLFSPRVVVPKVNWFRRALALLR